MSVYNRETADLIYRAVVARIEHQDQQGREVETKAAFLMALTTAQMIALAFTDGLMRLTLTGPITAISAWSGPFLCAAYIMTMLACFLALRPGTYQRVPEPQPLIDAYYDGNATDAKATIAATMATAFDHNKRLIEDKAAWLKRAFGLFPLYAALWAFVLIIGALT